MFPLVILGVLGALLFFAGSKASKPVVPVPGGGVVPSSTGAAWRWVTVDEWPKMAIDAPGMSPTADDLIGDSVPAHQMGLNQHIYGIFTADNGASWVAVPAYVTATDNDGAIGHAVVEIAATVPGGPPAGTEYPLSTGSNENEAYLDPASPNIDAFLSRHGQTAAMGVYA